MVRRGLLEMSLGVVALALGLVVPTAHRGTSLQPQLLSVARPRTQIPVACATEPPPEPPEEPPEPVDLQQDFEAGQRYGREIRDRFVNPVVDDPGLPYADSLVVVSATLLLAIVSLSTGAPRPSWLVALPGAPEWRALPYVLPAVAHGCQLAICWLLGAFAASAFEKGAYMDGWQEALRRCWRAGAFATGTLILCTQAKTYAVLSAAGLEPVLGASFEGDVAMINSVNELVVDALTQATALTAFRLYRAADAEGYDQ